MRSTFSVVFLCDLHDAHDIETHLLVFVFLFPLYTGLLLLVYGASNLINEPSFQCFINLSLSRLIALKNLFSKPIQLYNLVNLLSY